MYKDKLHNLKNVIGDWLTKEGKTMSKDQFKVLVKLTKSDFDYVNMLYNNNNLTKSDMVKCNRIYKKYRAISNIQFVDKDPFEGVTVVKPDVTR